MDRVILSVSIILQLVCGWYRVRGISGDNIRDDTTVEAATDISSTYTRRPVRQAHPTLDQMPTHVTSYTETVYDAIKPRFSARAVDTPLNANASDALIYPPSRRMAALCMSQSSHSAASAAPLSPLSPIPLDHLAPAPKYDSSNSSPPPYGESLGR